MAKTTILSLIRSEKSIKKPRIPQHYIPSFPCETPLRVAKLFDKLKTGFEKSKLQNHNTANSQNKLHTTIYHPERSEESHFQIFKLVNCQILLCSL